MKNANKAETSREAEALRVVAKGEKQTRAKEKPSAATVELGNGLSGETIGLDVGDRVSQFCRLNLAGEIAEEGRLHTNAASIEKHFAKLPAALIALEAGTQSGWIARLPRHFGHHVIVAHPRDLAAITSSKKKSDRNDAEKLARLARADLKLLNPTYVRSLESALDAIPLRARDGFVRARTLLVNVSRSLAKIEGQRLPATITKNFGERALATLPASLAGSLELLLRMIDLLSLAMRESVMTRSPVSMRRRSQAIWVMRKTRSAPWPIPQHACRRLLGLHRRRRFFRRPADGRPAGCYAIFSTVGLPDRTRNEALF